MKNIALTGFMASGKSETSRELAKISSFRLVDTDELIVEREKRSVNDIFAQDGEEYFRKVEKEVIKEVSGMKNTIISTGGGVVLFAENIDNLRKSSIIFNLAPSFDVIAARIETSAQSRPLMKDKNIDEIRERFIQREPYYNNCDHKIEINETHTPLMIARRIWEIYKGV